MKAHFRFLAINALGLADRPKPMSEANRAPDEEASWLLGVLDCECRKLGSRVRRQDDDNFRVVWTR
jgi:hypothetical protein